MTRSIFLAGLLLALASFAGCNGASLVESEMLQGADDSIPPLDETTVEVAIDTVLYTTANMNLRSSADSASQILMVIPSDTPVLVVDQTLPDNGFYKLKYNGLVGWGHSSYLGTLSSTSSSYLTVNGWTRPLAGYYVSQEYKGASVHNGIDLAKGYGSTVYAAHSGTVIAIIKGYCKPGYNCWSRTSGWALDGTYRMSGDKVVVKHSNGTRAVYDHCDSAFVWQGKWVNIDTAIGRLNATGNRSGPHLHFAIFTNSYSYSPTNPRNYVYWL